MKVSIGSDHHGVGFKAQAATWLQSQGIEVIDVGSHDRDQPCDYPEAAGQVGRLVSRGDADRGILICGSGVGMAITANKFPGVRAAVCDSAPTAQLTREHNGLNILCLSGTLWRERDLLPVVQAFIETPFAGGRHQRRLDKITEIEKSLGCHTPTP